MAIPGPKPKPDNEKVTRHDLTQGWIEVPDVAYPFNPQDPADPHALGKHPESRKRWAAGTLKWWRAIASMPHCILWGPAQWEFAESTAVIHDRWLKGDNARAGELRQREAILGTTLDARRDLRIRYVSPLAFVEAPADEEEDGAPPTDRVSDFDDARRRRLLNAE